VNTCDEKLQCREVHPRLQTATRQWTGATTLGPFPGPGEAIETLHLTGNAQNDASLSQWEEVCDLS